MLLLALDDSVLCMVVLSNLLFVCLGVGLAVWICFWSERSELGVASVDSKGVSDGVDWQYIVLNCRAR